MVSVKQHYENLLSDVYTWLMGGFDAAKVDNQQFFNRLNISPALSKLAVDLGAGSGFQSIPLAELGFTVTAIDFSQKLLDELTINAGEMPITVINDDIVDFNKYITTPCELVVCMTDTLTHLQSKDDALTVCNNAFDILENNGKLILTFRDLSNERKDTDRFIPLKSDDKIIFTCFVEYEPETVKIHDLVYIKTNEGWQLNTSCYRKLRLSVEWVETQLVNMGFTLAESSNSNGFQTIVAVKSS